MSDQYPYFFGKYVIEAEIGRGGFGSVFRALDKDLDRPVAIKIMDPVYLRDRRWVARFRREAQVMARLDHPHIVPIYDTGEENDRLYLAMKFIDGPNLTHLIAQEGRLSWYDVVKLTEQITSALDYAHARNIIHRDLKPGNILVSNGDAMLTDFGLAQMVDDNSQSLSVSGGITGTYNYMPPEVFNNEDATPASDVYALGCVLYEMLVGKMLFEGKTTAAIIGAHLKGISIEESMPEGTPAGTRRLLQTAVSKNPEERYLSAGELSKEMARLSTDRLSEPYAALEQAMADQRWEEALEIATDIRSQDPNYRDVVALEERGLAENEAARRRVWAVQWRTSSELALAVDNFDEVRGALIQWRRVAPEDPQISQVEKELALAEQYVALQGLIATGDWAAARPAAAAIFAQDPAFRDIVGLRAKIDANIETALPAEVDDTSVRDKSEGEQDLPVARATMAGSAVATQKPDAQKPVFKEPVEEQAAPAPTREPPDQPASDQKQGIPVWVFALAAITIIAIIGIGFVAWNSGGRGTEPEPAVEELVVKELVPEQPVEELVWDKWAVMPGGFMERALAGEFAGTEVTVDGPFEEIDAVLFEQSMEAFVEATGIIVKYIGGREFEGRISIAVDAGDPPDIANFPHPGLLSNFVRQGHIVDLTSWMSEDWLHQQYHQSWLDMGMMEGQIAGVWYRFNSKSLVWYPVDEFEAAGYEVPTNWDELMALTRLIADNGDTAWCIGIESGAATGWVVTDWTEDMMLRTMPLEIYDAWVDGTLPFSSPEVRGAIEIWSEIWFNPNFVHGGRDSIVTTFFGDSPTPMFEDPPRCWLHRQASFITGFFPEGVEAGVDWNFFYLPPVDHSFGKPFLITSDINAMFNDRPEVRALMEYFTVPQSASGWLQEGGALAAHQTATPDMYGQDVERGIAELASQATSFRLDGSDLMPGEVGAGSFWTGMTDYVSGAADLDTVLSEIDASWPAR
jgi:alpha-glucoside transport system substrate-binding protein